MDAGLPKGVFSIVHGSQTVAKAGAFAAHFTRNTNLETRKQRDFLHFSWGFVVFSGFYGPLQLKTLERRKPFPLHLPHLINSLSPQSGLWLRPLRKSGLFITVYFVSLHNSPRLLGFQGTVWILPWGSPGGCVEAAERFGRRFRTGNRLQSRRDKSQALKPKPPNSEALKSPTIGISRLRIEALGTSFSPKMLKPEKLKA